MKALITTLTVLIVIHFGLLEYRMSSYIVDAYANNVAPLSSTVETLANANLDMGDRIRRSNEVLNGVVVANRNLKSSLKESVEMYQEILGENNELKDKVQSLEWQVDVLEKALGENNDD